MSTRFSVYVYRNEEGSPLYIGQTSDIVKRDGEHRRSSDWHHDASPVEVLSTHESRCDALEAERVAIHSLRPRHNVMHNAGQPGTAGGAIRTMREAQGLTVRQLAELAGTEHDLLSYVENGGESPGRDWMFSILDALADNLRGAA